MPSYLCLIFHKGAQTTTWEKTNLFNKWYWVYWICTCKRIKLIHFLTHTMYKSELWSRDLNLRVKTLKLFRKKIINHNKEK